MRQTRRAARSRRATRSTSADERRHRARPASAGGGRARAGSRSSAGGGRPARAAGRGCGRARGAGARRRGRRSRPAPSRRAAPPRRPSRSRARGAWPRWPAPTPHSRCTGSGCRNVELAAGRDESSPSGFATPLATLARNFVRATPTVMGSPTCRARRRRSRTAISGGRPAIRSMPRTSRNASSIDSPSTSGVVSSKISNTARLASDVRREARLDDDRLAGTAAAPRRRPWPCGPRRLGLVARGEHDAPAHDHRPGAQARIVALLDRREEGVQVRVEDGGRP